MAAITPSVEGAKSVSRMRRFRMTRRERRNLLVALAFISPWIVGFLVFLVYPIYYTLRISFTQYSGFGTPQWTGLDNYRRMFHDPLFWTSVKNTLYYTGLAVPLGVVVAMVLALCMNQHVREVAVYRAILFIPSILPLFALSFIVWQMLDPTQGIVDQILRFFHIPGPNWFGDTRYAKLAIVLMAQYGAGQIALIFLARLKGIPLPLFEAAQLDGANAWQKFWGITLPMMTPIILYDIILGLSLGLTVFTQAYIITNGGPAEATTFYVFYLYNNAFKYSQLGYAAAMSWVLFIVTVILAIVIFKFADRWVHYETE